MPISSIEEISEASSLLLAIAIAELSGPVDVMAALFLAGCNASSQWACLPHDQTHCLDCVIDSHKAFVENDVVNKFAKGLEA